MAKVEDYIPVGDALAAVIDELRPKRRVLTVRSGEAYGRVCAQRLTAPEDVPESATSHMDGFAVISSDLGGATATSPVTLRVTGASRLGTRSAPQMKHGEAVRVATGGRLPPGSDAVLPTETVEERDGRLRVTSTPPRGSHVYQAGEDLKKGEPILELGQPVRAQDVGLLLKLGISRIRVWQSPTVSVIATGSELTDSPKPPAGKVRNSHSPVFLRLCEAQGCRALDGGVVADDTAKVSRAIRRSLSVSDFVMTLGGTSLGRHDVVGDAVASLSPSVVFHGIKMDRGRVTGIAAVGGKPVLVMPGPIQGAMNAFILLGVPMIRFLSGRKESGIFIPCVIGDEWKARERFAHFQKIFYVKLRAGEAMVAEPLQGETESARVLSRADGYVWVPERVTRIEKGSRVMVRLLPGFTSV